jgi:hypothetical protein
VDIRAVRLAYVRVAAIGLSDYWAPVVEERRRRRGGEEGKGKGKEKGKEEKQSYVGGLLPVEQKHSRFGTSKLGGRGRHGK